MDAKLQRSHKEKVLRRLAKLLEPLGYRRAKPTFFTRVGAGTLEFVHVHKFSFDSSFRVHLGTCAPDHSLVGVELNGPTSDPYRSPNSPSGKNYNFSFHIAEETLDRCAQNLAAFVADIGEPWFTSCRGAGTPITVE